MDQPSLSFATGMAQVNGNSINQRVYLIAVGRHSQCARGLVYHAQVIVLDRNGERALVPAFLFFVLPLCPIEANRNEVSDSDSRGTALTQCAVDRDATMVDHSLNLAVRGF